MLSFSSKNASKDLLAELPDRSKKVLVDRFGLTGKGDRRTLDSIGKEYGITRERVRQIENHGLSSVRDSKAYAALEKEWVALKAAIAELGSFLAEDTIINELAKNGVDANHLVFLLTVGHHFDDRRETPDFKARWHVDRQLADAIERALTKLYHALDQNKLMPEDEFVELFSRYLKEEGVRNRPSESLPRWLAISKRVGKNPLGEWGRTDSPHVRIRNTRDFAYLTLKRHGSPMHFSEVAKAIEKLFGRKTHPATTHNELIKDGRFVLVGRGLYALKEWGYEPGIVRDVISGILKREGPMTRDEIIERVKRERYVKDATIAVNLQNQMFTRLSDGRYALTK